MVFRTQIGMASHKALKIDVGRTDAAGFAGIYAVSRVHSRM